MKTTEHTGLRRPGSRRSPGRSGAVPVRSASGERCARLQLNRRAWNFFTHDHAARAPTAGRGRHRRHFRLTSSAFAFSLALWNGKDPSSRGLFGLTNSQGNHGEDVKEYYLYLDSTPTHSYMKDPL